MSDERFEERLRSIARRERTGVKGELLAGVGDVGEASEAANGNKPKASILLALIGAGVGYAAIRTFREQLGFEALLSLPPNMLMDIAVSEPLLGGAVAVLTLCALMAIVSLLRGQRAMAMMSFSWSAIGAAIGVAATA